MKLLLPLLLAPVLCAAPFRPESDLIVLERLPKSFLSLRPTREKSSATNRTVALALAQTYLQTAQRTSEPAFLNYAEGVLTSWAEHDEPPDSLFLRAVLLQHRHAFKEALLCLDRIPDHRPALLAKASILTTLGRLAEARRVFQKHITLASDLRGLAILSNISGLTGSLRSSYQVLDQAANAGGPSEDRSFALTILAEMALRLGDPEGAERHFRDSLALQPDNAYTLAVYSDFLLTENRRANVLQLIDPNTAAESLLLRRALARQSAPAPLAESFRKSGHWRELGILQLRILSDPASALETALKNWENQREPIDLHLFIHSAAAAGRPSAAAPAHAWIAENKFEDVRLNSPAL